MTLQEESPPLGGNVGTSDQVCCPSHRKALYSVIQYGDEIWNVREDKSVTECPRLGSYVETEERTTRRATEVGGTGVVTETRVDGTT